MTTALQSTHVSHEDALSSLILYAGKIRDVETLRALAWIAEWYAKRKLDTSPWYNADHGANEVHDAFGLAVTRAASAIEAVKGCLGIVRASHDLPRGGPPKEWR